MPRLIWSPSALDDVARLHAFLTSKNPETARRAVAAIRQGVKVLARHPQAGRPAPGRSLVFREWSISFGAAGYVALYRFDGPQVIVLAVRHMLEAGYRKSEE